MGISTSHTTTLGVVKKLGYNFDSDVISWKEAASPEPSYIIVGDNIDKNVSPRYMRIDNQVKSLHYWHSYAVHDRIDVGGLSGDGHVKDINSLDVSDVFPTVADCVSIHNNYVVLAARVIVENLPHFTFLHKCVIQHIPHKFSDETSKKSLIVSI